MHVKDVKNVVSGMLSHKGSNLKRIACVSISNISDHITTAAFFFHLILLYSRYLYVPLFIRNLYLSETFAAS